MFIKKQQSGYITIYMITVLGAVFLSLVLSASMYAISSSRFSSHLNKTSQVNYLLESCVELALLNLYKDQSVPQSDSYAISEGSCEYEIVQLSGGYEISAVVTDSETNTDSELVVEISISNFLEVESWQ